MTPDTVIRTLARNGYAAYIVGGAVRDRLTGLPSADVDILTDALPETVTRLFKTGKVRRVGSTFPICLVDGIEVASSRGDPDHFPESDLGCRDFTVNSMAWDPLTDTLIDPFGGQKDLADRRIRFTLDPDDRIAEDPVRMIRACRFAALLDARLTRSCLAAVRRHGRDAIAAAAPERIRIEVIKAMRVKKPSQFFRLLHWTGLLAGILPSLDRCFGLDGGPHHGETVFDHNLLVGDALPAGRPLLRLTGFLHDTGKFDARSVKDGKVTFHGHENFTRALEHDLDRLRFSLAEKAYILSLVRAHMRPLTPDTSPRAVRRLLATLAASDLPYRDFLRLRIADKQGNLAKPPYNLDDIRRRLQKIRDALKAQTAFSVNDLDISGTDIMETLGLAAGPAVGKAKQALFERVLDDPALNTRDRLIRLLGELE